MMSLKHLLPLVLLLSASVPAALSQDTPRLTFSPEFPKAGEPVTLTYTPLPSMTGTQVIPGIAYTYKDGYWTGHDISVKNDGNVWKGTFTPEPETGFMAFKFMVDTITDVNGIDNPFATMINADNGRPWPEGYAAWGLIRSEKYGRSIPGYFDFSKEKEVNDTIVYFWINNEITYNPSTSVAYAPLFAQSARAAKIDGAETRIRNAVRYLLSVGTEEAMLNARAIVADNQALSDSITKAILEKYPNGTVAMQHKYGEQYDFRDVAAIKKHLGGFVEQFPPTAEREKWLNHFGKSYDEFYTGLMIFDELDGDTLRRSDYLDKLSFFGCSTIFYKLVSIPHLRKDKTDAELLPFASELIARMAEKRKVKPAAYAYLSDSEWQNTADRTIENMVAEDYSEILKNTGNYEKALEYSRMAQKGAQYKRAEINDNMAEILKATGNTAELKKLLEISRFNNQVSPLQDAMLREIYVGEHGSEAGFDEYVAALNNPAEKSAIKEAVRKCRREGVMPAWKLTDAEGKEISSEMLKGKVYVIDFWANWCHPCKASLPGMKLAADYFKDDNNVCFLFVDTQENAQSNYKQKAKDYLKSKDLDLHLVFDGTRDGSSVNDLLCSKVMEQYTTSGIPLKVVVDADGNVRFLSVGYKGSPSALKDEMIEMIQQAKK